MLYDVHVELGDRSYPILIGEDVLSDIGQLTRKHGLSGHCLIISDENTRHHFGDIVSESLESEGFKTSIVSVPAGEASKSTATFSELQSACIEVGLDRSSFIIALGGGVIGDLAGYVAASFLRGIPFIQIPTSLLAMVDSSVGGKTGINLEEGKNLVGAFHQPTFVLVDLNTLTTLPKREMISGMAEVVKYGVIRDKLFFDKIEKEYKSLNALGDNQLLADVIGRCCEIKAEVVSKDEREGGLRAILNFGHTLGHAIENISGYGSNYIHGEAISIGMVYASVLSVNHSGLAQNEADRIKTLLSNIGLPVHAEGFSWSDLRKVMSVDKKSFNGTPRFVLASDIGTVSINNELSESDLEASWKLIL